MTRPDRAHHGTRRRRFFRSGELPLVLLTLLARRPQHGYDLMAELDRLFGPGYQPSPGSIYPALSALETEGLIEATADGDRKRYALTPVGRAALHARAGLLAEVEARTGARLSGAETLQPALDRFVARVRELSAEVDVATVERFLDEVIDGVDALAQREGRQ
jgi:DNA-binding PadR family transcriptional regulator